MKEETTKQDKQKKVYKAPTCEIIEMQQEGVLCQSSYNTGHDIFEDGDSVKW